jgi:hypothetical protein
VHASYVCKHEPFSPVLQLNEEARVALFLCGFTSGSAAGAVFTCGYAYLRTRIGILKLSSAVQCAVTRSDRGRVPSSAQVLLRHTQLTHQRHTQTLCVSSCDSKTVHLCGRLCECCNVVLFAGKTSAGLQRKGNVILLGWQNWAKCVTVTRAAP